MRDILPAEMRRREYVIRIIRETYERYGFEPLETPAVENIETLTGKYGEEAGGLIFKILKRGEGEASGVADLALRYDLTVPLARVVAEYGERLPKFFKRYQIQPVYRAERPARGRFREFYQCDVDAIGSRSLIVEAELCAAASDVLSLLGFKNFTIRLNHRAVLTGVLDGAGVPAELHTAALTAIDKLDKIGADGVQTELEARGIAAESGARLLGFFQDLHDLRRAAEIVAGDAVFDQDSTADSADAENIDDALPHVALNRAVLGRLVEFIGDHEAGARGCDELRSILELARASGAGARLSLDPSLARGLSYYTGAIMEISHPDLAGSLGGGGRYDNLIGMFSGRDVPACGFSLGLERIIVVMTEREMFPPEVERAGADVLVTMWDEAASTDALALARLLRAGGIRADVYPEAGKVKNQLKYASARGVRFVTIAGPDERERGEVSLKDLQTGEQQTLARERIVETVRAGLESSVA
jgi:histidyl-tRNA synthetase